jgi:CRP-like cAMP-binding protein
MEDIINEIRKSHLFKNVSKSEIEGFITIHPCHIASYHRGDCVISKEEASKRIGIVLDGVLGIYSDNFYGGHTLIGLGGRHYLFGFIAMFYNNQHSITTLYAHESSRIAFFDLPKGQTSIEFIQTTSPQILSNIYEMLTYHIRDDFDRQQIINSNSVTVKLIRYLLYLHKNTQHLEFGLKMNRTELSSFLGVYRTSLSREFTKLSNAKLINCYGNKVKILNLQALIDIETNSYG